MRKPKVIILRTAGTNCDEETAFAFRVCGASTDLVHINELHRCEKSLNDYQILAIPGGFTYGDDIASGKILANEIKYKLGEELSRFIKNGNLVIGICNGFQVLVSSGILPGMDSNGFDASLSFNDSGRFEARWVYLKVEKRRRKGEGNKCVWTRNLKKIIYLPVAHGEGKFIPKDQRTLSLLEKNGQVIFRYVDEKGDMAGYPFNPNGSINGIAGVCDITGRVLGMMPHPERHVLGTQHPRWTRERVRKFADGVEIFRNGVRYARGIL